MGLNKHNKWVIYQPTSLPRLITFNAFYYCLWPKTLTFEWFGSKSPSNQLKALFLTTKKLIISTQSNPCFLSTITRELFLLTSLAAHFFSCLLKLLLILELDTNSSDLYSLQAVPTFISNFYQFLSLSNTLPALLGKFLDLR